MPSPTTALTLIEDALGLTNSVGVDQTLTADEVSDCLRVFNDVLEDWSTQNLAVYGQANQTFNTVANQATYTIGSGGNWNTVRPERINEPAYATVNSVSFPYFMVNQAEYNLIGFKGQTGGGTDTGQCYLYVNEYPLGLVTLWPVPASIFPITFSIDRVLSQVTNAATAISFPQGYAKAFKYELGCELPSVFGKKLSQYPEIVAKRNQIVGSIKRANKRPVVMGYDVALLGGNQYVDWRTGN